MIDVSSSGLSHEYKVQPDLDDVEIYAGPSEWELDRAAVFAWAKRCLSWGQARRIPAELLTSNLRCSVCETPRKQAVYVSKNRDLYCEKHNRARLYQLRKKPKSKRRLRQLAEFEWEAREYATIWGGIP